VVILLHKFLEANVIQEAKDNNNGAPPCMNSDKSLFSFVTSPGPFNFLEDDAQSPSLTPNPSMTVSSSSHAFSTPVGSAALGKRKRRGGGGATSGPDNDGLTIANDFASGSVVEESCIGGSNSVDMMSFLEEVEEALGASAVSTLPKRLRQGDTKLKVPYQLLVDFDNSKREEKENAQQIDLEEMWRETILSR